MNSVIDCRLGLDEQNIRVVFPAVAIGQLVFERRSGGFGFFDQGFLADYYDDT